MGIEIEGIPDPANLLSYSVSEDATSLDPNSPSGGYGQIQFVSTDWPNSKMLSRSDVTLIDDLHGRISGTVTDVSPDGATVSVTADSELGKFNAHRVAMPFSGTMSDYIQYLMDLSGMYSLLDFQAPNRTIHVPGFLDNVWDRMKLLLAAHQLELALVGDVVVVREPHATEVSLNNSITLSTNVNRQTSALAVDVRYYNYRPITQGEVYPVKGEEPSIQSVEAGETIEFELTINASLSEVHQPVPQVSVGPGDRSGTKGVYTIVGQDNLPIMPAQWLDSGGRLDVYLTDEPGVLRCVLTGANIEHLAPFRIAESAGGTDYNSLHITGDGVAWEAESVRLYTGADPMTVAEEVGATVDNPYISTPSQAYFVGSRTAAAYSGATVGIDGSLPHIEEMDQAFGNFVGARVYHDGAFHRVETTSYNAGNVGYSGKMDTTIADFNKQWEGKPQAYFNSVWDDYDMGQFSLQPLYGGEPAATGVNLAPPLEMWELTGGAVYDPATQEVTFPTVGARATSPWIRVDQPSVISWEEEWWLPNSDAGTPRRLIQMTYADIDQTSIGANGNGRAIDQREIWTKATHSSGEAGGNNLSKAVWTRWTANFTSAYGVPGMKMRAPTLKITR